MNFDGGHRVSRVIQRPIPQPTRSVAQPTQTPQQQQQVGKKNAIQKMMNVYEPKKGGGCGSCSGAK